jgi:acetylglutamate kinase
VKVLIKIGGTLLDDASMRASIAAQIAAQPEPAVAVVHGGGKQMTRFLEERGVQSTFVRGLRVTTPEIADAVLKVFAGSVNSQLVASLNVAGARAVGLTGIDAGLAVAEQLDPDLGFVGRVVSSDARLLDTLTASGYLPVVACVAGGANGEVFNVNGDSMAVAVARGWAADRLIFLTDVAGVLDAEKQVLPVLTVSECRGLVAGGIASGGMQAKLDAACDAVENGVGEVRIVRGSDSDIVTRVMSGETAGTAIVLERRK